MLHSARQSHSVELLQDPWDEEMNRKCFEAGQELLMNNIGRGLGDPSSWIRIHSASRLNKQGQIAWLQGIFVCLTELLGLMK